MNFFHLSIDFFHFFENFFKKFGAARRVLFFTDFIIIYVLCGIL